MSPDNNPAKKEIPEGKSLPAKDKNKDKSPKKNTSHALLDIFLGYTIDTHDKIIQSQATTDETLRALEKAHEGAEKLSTTISEQIAGLKKIKSDLAIAIDAHKLSPWQTWLYQWSLVLYYILVDAGMVIIVEAYCRWHGASFISTDLYSPINVETLSKISFVNAPTTLSIAAEVLTWSSLGVWSQQNYANTVLLLKRKFRFAEHTLSFVGTLMRNTSVAAIIIILIRISKFSVFGVSLDESNPLMFDITIGLSFLLGFFGDDAYRILKAFKDQLVKGLSNENGIKQKDD